MTSIKYCVIDEFQPKIRSTRSGSSTESYADHRRGGTGQMWTVGPTLTKGEQMNIKSSFSACALLITAAMVFPISAQQPQGGGQGRGGRGGFGGPPLLMTTTAFEDGGVIPAKFVGA